MAGQEMIATTIERVQYDQERDWYRVHTANGRFDTRRRDLAEEAASLIGAPVRLFFTTGKPSGNINRHTGQPFPPPRYYESADRVTGNDGSSIDGIETIGATVEKEMSRITSSSDGPGEDPRRSWRICLQTGGKLALQTVPLMPNEQRTFETQKQIALAWAKFFYFTPPPAQDTIGSPVPTPQQAYEERPLPEDEDRWAGVGMQASAAAQDDIPF